MDQKTKLAVLKELDRMAGDSEAHLPLGEAIDLAISRAAERKTVVLTAELRVVMDEDGNFPNLIVYTDDGEAVQIVKYDVREVH